MHLARICVSDLNGGWDASQRGVDLVLFKGMRYLVAKIPMELLEGCRIPGEQYPTPQVQGTLPSFRIKAL